MCLATFLSAFLSVVGVFLFVVGLFVYSSLIRQISARKTDPSTEPAKQFSWPEAILAGCLMTLLVLNVVAGASTPTTDLSTRDLAANLFITIVVVIILLGFLSLRGFDLDALAGFSRISFGRAAFTGALLLLLAYPLLAIADTITQRFLGGDSSRQNIVELFSGSRTMEQRVLIIILAVGVAPFAEELVFRFFLYGVLRRYFGRFIGLVTNALLFAAVHQHLPSFAPLFVLGSCFTLAYEWSGSILVSMTMHSLFNSLTLILLAFPQLLQQ